MFHATMTDMLYEPNSVHVCVICESQVGTCSFAPLCATEEHYMQYSNTVLYRIMRYDVLASDS